MRKTERTDLKNRTREEETTATTTWRSWMMRPETLERPKK